MTIVLLLHAAFSRQPVEMFQADETVVTGSMRLLQNLLDLSV